MSEKTAPKPESGPSPIGEISQEPSAFEAFLDANQKKLVLIGILVILCLIGYVIFDGLKTLSAKNAAGDVAAARTVPELEAVSKTHSGTNAGGTALLLKSQLLWQEQQQQEAITAVQDFISQYPEHPALGNAYASLGSYKQQLGEIEEAKDAFLKSAETKSSASSLSLLALGDLALTAGNGDEAKEFYDRITTEYEDSHFQVKGMARERLKLIGVEAPTEKGPEPAKPTFPPTATSAPVQIPATSVAQPAPATQPAPQITPDDLPPLELPAEPSEPTPPVEPVTPEATEAPASE